MHYLTKNLKKVKSETHSSPSTIDCQRDRFCTPHSYILLKDLRAALARLYTDELQSTRCLQSIVPGTRQALGQAI